MSDFSAVQKQMYAAHDVAPDPEDLMIENQKIGEIFKLIDTLDRVVQNPTERLCLKAIRRVFESVDQLDFLNKRAVLVYVRDISGLDSKRLSVAMSSLRKQYKKLTKDKERFDIF